MFSWLKWHQMMMVQGLTIVVGTSSSTGFIPEKLFSIIAYCHFALWCSSIRHDKRAGVYYREFIYKHTAPILKAFQNIIILGDFNMIPENPHFLDFLRRHQLKQLVTSPTHTLGATLDFIITSVPVQQVTVKPVPFSDHHIVCATLDTHN